ncbi:hypothetical protein Tco_1044839 [Tanacetum coccineum]|uniref:Uncharacterized protein n=1 Tax=Tanacetum coccineum TaxID=301880 RepID=A0ABQ5GRM3_9ASTR
MLDPSQGFMDPWECLENLDTTPSVVRSTPKYAGRKLLALRPSRLVLKLSIGKMACLTIHKLVRSTPMGVLILFKPRFDTSSCPLVLGVGDSGGEDGEATKSGEERFQKFANYSASLVKFLGGGEPIEQSMPWLLFCQRVLKGGLVGPYALMLLFMMRLRPEFSRSIPLWQVILFQFVGCSSLCFNQGLTGIVDRPKMFSIRLPQNSPYGEIRLHRTKPWKSQFGSNHDGATSMGRQFLEFNLSRFSTEDLAVLVSQTLSSVSDLMEISSLTWMGKLVWFIFKMASRIKGPLRSANAKAFIHPGNSQGIRNLPGSPSFLGPTGGGWTGAVLCEQEGCTWSYVTLGIGFYYERRECPDPEVEAGVAGAGAGAEAWFFLSKEQCSDNILSFSNISHIRVCSPSIENGKSLSLIIAIGSLGEDPHCGGDLVEVSDRSMRGLLCHDEKNCLFGQN